MTRPAADRVKVEWSGTGTGVLTLGSAVSGFQGFPSALDGLPVSYSIEHTTSSEAEAGYGTYTSAGNTLSRDYRTYPTLGGAAVNFSAGTKHVRLTAISADLAPNITTSDPTADDGIAAGYRIGSKWINTATPSIWECVDAGTGGSPSDAVWVRLDGSAGGAVDSVNGQTGTVVLDAYDIETPDTPANYTPVGSPSGAIGAHLAGLDTALGTLGGDAAPATDPSVTGATYELTVAYQLHTNGYVESSQASQRLNVPAATPKGRAWRIYPKHDGVTVGVTGDAGSVNAVSGGIEQLVNGGVAIVEVDSNAGSAPVVLVRGDIILVANQVAGIKTYDNEDHSQDFDLTSGAGTQTFPAVATLQSGYYVNIFNASGGNITIDGADADVTLPSPGAVTVRKHTSGALWAIGSAGITVLDAA